MKKRNRSIAGGVIWTVVAVVLAGVLISSLKSRKGIRDWEIGVIHLNGVRNNNMVYKTESYNFNQIDEIDVSLMSESLVIADGAKPGDLTIQLVGYGWNKTTEPEIRLEGGKLSLKVPGGLKFSWGKRSVVMAVPAGVKKEDLKVSLKLMSGSVKVSNLNCKDLGVGVMSGSVKVGGSGAENLNVKTVSGSVSIDCDASVLNCETTSGSVRVSGKFDGMNVKTTSGSVKISDMACPTMPCNIKTTSGSVRIGLPADSKIFVDAHTMSGSVRNEFGNTKDSSAVDIVVNTTSGSVFIGQL